MTRVTPAAILSLLVCSAALATGNPYLVQDLDASSTWAAASSSPSAFEVLGGRVLFAATGSAEEGIAVWGADPTTRQVELLEPRGLGWQTGARAVGSTLAYWWETQPHAGNVLIRTDGSLAGTWEVHSTPWMPQSSQGDRTLGFAGDLLLFAGHAPETGWELWVTDGTSTGTRMLLDLRPGEHHSLPRAFREVGSLACFVFWDSGSTSRLACSDGTAAGTRIVEGLAAIDTYDVSPVVAGGRLYLLASNGHGSQLATTDGTSGGTRVLTDLPGESPIRSPLVPLDGLVYFVANNVVNGAELWRSDGTPSGTRRISEFGYHDPFSQGFGEHWVAEAGGFVYFCASDGLGPLALWRSDGTPQGTELFGPAGCELVVGSHSTRASTLTTFDGKLILVAHRADVGTELFVAGVSGQLELLADTCPGPCSGIVAPPRWINELLLFEARDAEGRSRILRTDGTPPGTLDAATVPGGSATLSLTAYGSPAASTGRWLGFAGGDDLHGFEPWLADLDSSSSQLLADLAYWPGSSFPTSMRRLGDGVVFRYCDGHDPRWARATESPDSVVTLGPLQWLDFGCGHEDLPSRIEVANGYAFLLEGLLGSKLRRTDGTASGDLVLLEVPGGESLRDLVSGAGRVWFFRERSSGTELWSSDGTSAGTRLERSFGAQGWGLGHLSWASNRLVFSGEIPPGTRVAWIYDPATAGLTVLSIDLGHVPLGPQAPEIFVGWNGGIYFFGGVLQSPGLWRHDPVLGTTDLLVSLTSSSPSLPLGVGADGVYFLVESPQVELWRSTGSPEGTGLVHVLSSREGADTGLDANWTSLGGWTLFRAFTQESGFELWASDGGESGTFQVAELVPGPGSSQPGPPVVVDDAVYFSARDPRHGFELWRLDATNGALRRISDIAPGSRSSFPSELIATDTHLFFRASDGLHGHELWAMPLEEADCQPSTRTLCLRQGRFQLEAHWRDFTGGAGDGIAVPLTSDTGYFWFFDQANVETVIKVLDALGVNNRYWVYYGALSNVEYSIDVTDTATRVKRRYFNPAGRYASVGDNDAFDPAGEVTAEPTHELEPPGNDSRPLLIDGFAAPAAASGTCTPSATRLCLQQGRFAVEATWRDFQGHTGVGAAVPLSADTGYFWFFAESNVEAILKVLDGRPVNEKFWVYYGALSNVEYTITVTDTVTGLTRNYFNPAGRYASVGDNDAF